MFINQLSGGAFFIRSKANGGLRGGVALIEAPPQNIEHSGVASRGVCSTSVPARLSLSLVLPCFNEEPNLRTTIADAQEWFALNDVDGEIIAVNDGSSDGSKQLLEQLRSEVPNLRVVEHDKNRGYGAAIRSGCDQATKQWIAFMDADGQFKARDFERLLPLTDEADYVTGIRAKRADTVQRWLNSRMYNLLVQVLLGVHPSDINCGMKIFRRAIWPTIRPVHATGALINAEMFYAMRGAHIPFREALVPHYPRLAGKPTGANLRVILRTFKELWKLKRARSGHAVAQPRQALA